MNTETILRHLENSGFRIVGSDGAFIWLEDPTCFTRSLSNFIEIAWIAITAFAAFLLLGWAIASIRGAKSDTIKNVRNLFLMFSVLAASRPVVNAVWGGDLMGMGCKVIQVPISNVNTIINAAKLKLKTQEENALFENIDIYDSANTSATPNIMGNIDMAMPDAPINANGIVSYGMSTMYTPSGPVSFMGTDGRRHNKTGGSSSWRHNNPGNIRCPPIAFGAIACDGWLIFPSEASGLAGHIAKLKSPKYQNAWHKECPDLPRGSLGAAICVWAPPSDNNQTRSYMQHVSSATGIPITAQMSSLSDSQLRAIAQQQKIREGWTVGRETIE